MFCCFVVCPSCRGGPKAKQQEETRHRGRERKQHAKGGPVDERTVTRPGVMTVAGQVHLHPNENMRIHQT